MLSGALERHDGLALLTRYTYDTAGRQESVVSGVRKNGSNTDTTTTKLFYDDLGRRSMVAENQIDFEGTNEADIGGGTNNDEDRVTAFAYTGLGQTWSLIALNPPSDPQWTAYSYEDPYNANLVTRIRYPDGDSLDDNVKTTYHLDGSVNTRTDQRGIVHTYEYNERRQPIFDDVTAVGGTVASKGVDDSVLSIGRTYDSLGRLEKVTSYDDVSTGSPAVVNEVKYNFGSVGKLSSIDQDHADAVGSGTGHQTLGFTYTTTASSNVYTKGLRLEELAYPLVASAKLNHYYGEDGELNDRLRRLRYQKLWEGALAAGNDSQTLRYTYNGVGRTVRMENYLGQIDVDWNMNTASGVYGNWDRFGRTLKQRWFRSSTTLDQFDYTYDYAGNRLTRDIPSSLYATNNQDQVFAYDSLQRLKNFDQGTLSGCPYRKLNPISWARFQRKRWERAWKYEP